MADTYDIYTGPAAGELILAETGITDLEIPMPATLDYLVDYYWRIDATNEFGVTVGDEWYFTTIAFNPPQPSWRLISGGSGQGPNDDPPGTQGTDWEWTSENKIIPTTRRLVAVANSALWFEDI